MKKLHNLLFALFFVVLATGSAQASGGEESSEHKGKSRNDFYPKKPADKSLAVVPGKIELLEPKALSQVSGNQVTLKWKPAENAESYKIQVATDPNFKWILTEQAFLKDTSFNVTGLEAGEKYFWRVTGLKPDNEPGWISGFSTMSSFEVK